MTSELVIVITGASRGFGRALATMAARSFNPSSDFDVMLVLVARSTEGLEETARLVRDQTGVPGNNFQVSCHAMDLGDLKQLDENIDQLIQEFDRQGCTTRKIIFIQNAGTIGFLGPCRNSPSLKDLQSNVDLNITSCLWISARLTRYANSSEKPTDLIIVNVSSLVAIADFPTFGMYSAGKAARDKYHTLIASEETTSSTGDQTKPRIRTLNYAPGPLETAMVDEIRANLDRVDASLQPGYRQQALDPIDSAQKLFRLLEEDDFASGSHIDYYDLPDV